MFGIRPPQPLPTRAVAMQIVQQQQRDFDAHRLVVEPPGGEVAVPPPSPAIEFEVDYTLGEYLSILRDHLAFTLRRQSRATRLRQTLLPLAVALPALVAAWLRRSRLAARGRPGDRCAGVGMLADHKQPLGRVARPAALLFQAPARAALRVPHRRRGYPAHVAYRHIGTRVGRHRWRAALSARVLADDGTRRDADSVPVPGSEAAGDLAALGFHTAVEHRWPIIDVRLYRISQHL